MDDLRRQLWQKEDKLRRLSKSHARLKETAREATARAQAAEALVTTARDVQRRAEKAMAKLDKTQKRAALSKQMVGERDEALRAKETSAREWAAQLQAKEEQLEAAFQRTAELDDEVRRGREMLSKRGGLAGCGGAGLAASAAAGLAPGRGSRARPREPGVGGCRAFGSLSVGRGSKAINTIKLLGRRRLELSRTPPWAFAQGTTPLAVRAAYLAEARVLLMAPARERRLRP
eukprot:COSAG04_NODE_5626_length_1547_cov_0.931630_1_plen_231_part_10